MIRLFAALSFCSAAFAQTICQPTPRYTPCELAFDIPAAKPDQRLELRAEFRSPRARTALVNAFWDGGARWVIRFTPTEAGTYEFRIMSKLSQFEGKTGQFTATPNKNPGWLRAANLHHFANVDENVLTPHLWMGATILSFSSMTLPQWKQLVETRASQHFNHLAVTLVDEASAAQAQSPELFRTAEEKIRYANEHGIIIDIAFFAGNNLGNRILKDRSAREQWYENAISRIGPLDVTWQGIDGWETYEDGRALLKEIGEALTQNDPYKHTRSSRAAVSSAPLVDDGWLRYRSYSSTDAELEAVDQQTFQYPAVNNFQAKDAAEFRRDLWTASMNGQYPSPVIADEQEAAQMKVWYEFMAAARHWEEEPFFDVENGRSLAYEGVEYIVYVEKPGPVTVNLERQKYDIEWLNPLNGETIAFKKPERIEVFHGEPPDNSHDWVLHISREGHKAGMLKSFKFDSREDQPPLQLQIVESNPEKVPFDIDLPGDGDLRLSKPVPFRIKMKRETKATRQMQFVWTGEVTVDAQSFRVIGTGNQGTLRIPANIAIHYPAALHIKVSGLNALGKLYTVDRNYTLTQ